MGEACLERTRRSTHGPSEKRMRKPAAKIKALIILGAFLVVRYESGSKTGPPCPVATQGA